MAVELPRTETALGDCHAHFGSVAAAQVAIDATAIESYLAHHVAVMLCAEIEATVHAYVIERMEMGGCDEPTKAWIRSFKRGVVRNAKHSEIADVVGRFGPEFKDRYENLVTDAVGEAGIAQLGNAVGVRDSTAHDTPPTITFRELERAVVVAKSVLQAVRTSLGLP